MTDIAVDACCLINLLAAGPILSLPPPGKSPRKRRVVSTEAGKPPGIGLTLHIPAKVTQEIYYLLEPDEEDNSKLVKTQIDLASFIRAGVIHSCDLEGEKEFELFVQLAAMLDDGEAACFAIAHSRRWLLATDDRPAIKLAAKAGLMVITTPELVKHWANTSGATNEEVGAVIRNIQAFARFVPRPDSPECEWWISMLANAAE